MNCDMLLLAERLVIAMETISQDVKNISAYVYDLSCSMSYLCKDKRDKECISVVAHDEGDDPPSVTSEAAQDASAEWEYSGQYKQADERSSLDIADPELRDSSYGDIASTSIDPHENLASYPIFTDRIKREQQSEDDINDELCNIHNMCGDGRNVDREYVTHIIQALGEQPRAEEMESAKDISVLPVRVDSEERPYKCSVCQKSFKDRYKLKRHTQVHTGERPYKCHVCGKAWAQSSNLTIHMRCHTGEKPYNCTLCGKSFSHSTSLGIHMRTHTGEKPYKCTLCGREFRHASSLTQHMHVHSTEHAFQ